MVEPSTWKALGEYSGKAWSAVGPLVGVLVGALLARSWGRRRWLIENRKQECQELLGAITKSATQMLTSNEAGGDIRSWESWDSYLGTVQSFHTRIFIAEDVDKEKLFDRWVPAVREFGSGHDRHKFDEAIEKICATIVRMAIRQN